MPPSAVHAVGWRSKPPATSWIVPVGVGAVDRIPPAMTYALHVPLEQLGVGGAQALPRFCQAPLALHD
jgi:hypothetical protein